MPKALPDGGQGLYLNAVAVRGYLEHLSSTAECSEKRSPSPSRARVRARSLSQKPGLETSSSSLPSTAAASPGSSLHSFAGGPGDAAPRAGSDSTASVDAAASPVQAVYRTIDDPAASSASELMARALSGADRRPARGYVVSGGAWGGGRLGDRTVMPPRDGPGSSYPATPTSAPRAAPVFPFVAVQASPSSSVGSSLSVGAHPCQPHSQARPISPLPTRSPPPRLGTAGSPPLFFAACHFPARQPLAAVSPQTPIQPQSSAPGVAQKPERMDSDSTTRIAAAPRIGSIGMAPSMFQPSIATARPLLTERPSATVVATSRLPAEDVSRVRRVSGGDPPVLAQLLQALTGIRKELQQHVDADASSFAELFRRLRSVQQSLAGAAAGQDAESSSLLVASSIAERASSKGSDSSANTVQHELVDECVRLMASLRGAEQRAEDERQAWRDARVNLEDELQSARVDKGLLSLGRGLRRPRPQAASDRDANSPQRSLAEDEPETSPSARSSVCLDASSLSLTHRMSEDGFSCDITSEASGHQSHLSVIMVKQPSALDPAISTTCEDPSLQDRRVTADDQLFHAVPKVEEASSVEGGRFNFDEETLQAAQNWMKQVESPKGHKERAARKWLGAESRVQATDNYAFVEKPLEVSQFYVAKERGLEAPQDMVEEEMARLQAWYNSLG